MFTKAPWHPGQPRSKDGKCVSINATKVVQPEGVPQYTYGSSLTDCSKNLPFYCITDPISLSEGTELQITYNFIIY